MNASPSILLTTLAAGGQRAHGLASVICALVKEGAELGALEDRDIGTKDEPHPTKALPREWLERLGRAIELGILDHPTPAKLRKVVDRILAPPLPAHIES